MREGIEMKRKLPMELAGAACADARRPAARPMVAIRCQPVRLARCRKLVHRQQQQQQAQSKQPLQGPRKRSKQIEALARMAAAIEGASGQRVGPQRMGNREDSLRALLGAELGMQIRPDMSIRRPRIDLRFRFKQGASGREELVEERFASNCDSASSFVKRRNRMDLIKANSKIYSWTWDENNKSHECIVSKDKLEVCFHPHCSESAAAIIGSQPLKRNGNYYYWEIRVFDKTYGTSVMFGLCTKQQPLHVNDYYNLIGLDQHGWSLSHKGLIWHDGKCATYTQPFPADKPITIGLLFDTKLGELSYFMNGQNLGVAFSGLNDFQDDLYPAIGSTAKSTRMRLMGSYCGYVSLLERSSSVLIKSFDKEQLEKYLKSNRTPMNLVNELMETAETCAGQISQLASNKQHNQQYNCNNNTSK